MSAPQSYEHGYWKGREDALAFLEGATRDGLCAEQAIRELRSLTVRNAPREMIPHTYPVLLAKNAPRKEG